MGGFMRIALSTTLLLAATVAGGLQAQRLGEFGRLEPGQTVRIKTVGGSRFSTRLGGGATDSVRFAHALIPFAPEGVDTLWVRGHATVTGAIVGAAIAAPITFGLMAWTCEFVSEGSGCDQYGLVTLLALGGGAAGALVGGAIGYLVPKWRLRYARDRDLAISPMLAPGGRIGVAVRF
jgi:hypothetical protein